ncbi:L-idonate 5-dehydrogenase [Amaricoccus sp.]|uniref:L-idonate 5-dehydrogenase n=1 Tax=Amaricoccus sp. TaxID=1872485 RepID=UPI001B62ECFC|nr:L-idonate 5-dehydrogenase [Amaricoccus sp.]MBP7002694.1 L-idonate 5-dehydrogenase [Amaricoccus sp.]
MRGVILHAPKDLRIEPVAEEAPGPGQVRVAIRAGGICGSDLHYYNHGGTASIRIREPMALGHEIAGTIAEVGAGVEGLAPGMRVAVNPSRACGRCIYCQAGRQNQCLDMHFIGSAMRMPHDQGGFRQSLTVEAAQAVPIADALSFGEAAMAEPLAVCLHAARIAGPLIGRRVLITGAGPIGNLVVVAARLGGAREIVVTDLDPFALSIAERVGATTTLDLAADPEALAPYAAGKGVFDVHFEASGSQAALRGALPVVRPGGVVVQLGLGGDFALPINAIITKELQIRGSFRFHEEFELAVALMGQGLVDVRPVLTHTIPFEQAVEAFETANDRSVAMKVQLSF